MVGSRAYSFKALKRQRPAEGTLLQGFLNLATYYNHLKSFQKYLRLDSTLGFSFDWSGVELRRWGFVKLLR